MAVASPALAPLVTRGMADTGPRSAEALSMPGLRPAALPPEGGGGGENGCAGGAKLVTPGAADIGGVTGGRGIIGCTADAPVLGGTGGGVITFAFGEGAYIPVDACEGAIACAVLGGAVWVTGANVCAGTLVVGALATEDPDEDTADIAVAGREAAGPATALAPEPTIPTTACIPLTAAPSASDAPAATPASTDPPEIAGIDGAINAVPNASSVAP